MQAQSQTHHICPLLIIHIGPFYFVAGTDNKKSGATPASNSQHQQVGMQQQHGNKHHSSIVDHHSSGFGTKDSSDSKSHDSGIDSIEKPGMSIFMFTA